MSSRSAPINKGSQAQTKGDRVFHFDFTVRVWTLLSQVVALIGLGTFLFKVSKGVRSVVNAANVILDQHREVYGWYREVKDKPWPVTGD
jgi:hypothetical protein